MWYRILVFKVVFLFLGIGSAIGLAVHEGVSFDDPKAAAGSFRRYPLPLGLGCAGVALLAAFSDMWLPGRRKNELPTYTDEEFLAKFGGTRDPERPLK